MKLSNFDNYQLFKIIIFFGNFLVINNEFIIIEAFLMWNYAKFETKLYEYRHFRQLVGTNHQNNLSLKVKFVKFLIIAESFQ